MIKVNVRVHGLLPGAIVPDGHPLIKQFQRWAKNEDRMSGAVICEFVGNAKTENTEITEANIEIATALLGGEGLNHSSWMKKSGLDVKKDRKTTKPLYDDVLKHFEDKIEKQQTDWFFKRESQ